MSHATRMPLWISRGFTAWMALSVLCIAAFGDTTGPFYRCGPQPDLVVLSIGINTWLRYTALVVYCIANSVFRTLQHDMLGAWTINHIQDTERPKPAALTWPAYEIMSVNAVYYWFDWFVYMHVLLTQVDLFLIEMAAQVACSWATTAYYLRLPLASAATSAAYTELESSSI